MSLYLTDNWELDLDETSPSQRPLIIDDRLRTLWMGILSAFIHLYDTSKCFLTQYHWCFSSYNAVPEFFVSDIPEFTVKHPCKLIFPHINILSYEGVPVVISVVLYSEVLSIATLGTSWVRPVIIYYSPKKRSENSGVQPPYCSFGDRWLTSLITEFLCVRDVICSPTTQMLR